MTISLAINTIGRYPIPFGHMQLVSGGDEIEVQARFRDPENPEGPNLLFGPWVFYQRPHIEGNNTPGWDSDLT